jgi:hypothetical protein
MLSRTNVYAPIFMYEIHIYAVVYLRCRYLKMFVSGLEN